MTSPEAGEVSTFDFKASFKSDGDVIRADLSGNADTVVLDSVEKFISELHVEAARGGAREVIVDLRELDFVSSSCLKVFVTWIERIRGIEEDRRYLLRFVSDPRRPWQRRSLSALSCFAVDLIKIEL